MRSKIWYFPTLPNTCLWIPIWDVKKMKDASVLSPLLNILNILLLSNGSKVHNFILLDLYLLSITRFPTNMIWKNMGTTLLSHQICDPIPSHFSFSILWKLILINYFLPKASFQHPLVPVTSCETTLAPKERFTRFISFIPSPPWDFGSLTIYQLTK